MTTTQAHDSTTCTAGFNGQPCVMCHFAREFEKSSTESPSEASGAENQPAGFLESGPENVPETILTQTSPIPATPDFEHEWLQAPETHKRYTERNDAEWWLMRGVWLGIQYERERGLVAMNGDLKEMQRLARERIER